ncbi:acyl-CoA Delta(11) desaturase [Orussus abietinus]|uniref:acyl-CoA Delta(11) desaturase n=1 Tax=Orussus abietinus TaxID=222816 RepID=UPI0006261E8F|nr:acyl-CoA Delta(11) desaturase [Orussus abietinus]
MSQGNGGNPTPKKREINWILVLWYIHLHVLGLYSLLLLFTEAKWMTVFFTFLIIGLAQVGIAAGAHRLWTHETFEASKPVRIFLMLAHTLAGVGPIYDWVLMHKIHHKFYGTDKDPFNHNRGFIYSHFLTNVMTPHPDQEQIERDIDMRDIESDGVVWIQRRFYWLMFIIVGLLLPINAPAEYWGESIANSVLILGFFRLAISLHMSWLVNSAMLIWGLSPGDKYPVDDNSVFIVRKSYWPNYHYLLPWDWKCGEFGTYDSGCITFLIRSWASLGLVTKLKTATTEAIRDTLGKAATKKKTMKESLDELKNVSEEDAIKMTLQAVH